MQLAACVHPALVPFFHRALVLGIGMGTSICLAGNKDIYQEERGYMKIKDG